MSKEDLVGHPFPERAKTLEVGDPAERGERAGTLARGLGILEKLVPPQPMTLAEVRPLPGWTRAPPHRPQDAGGRRMSRVTT